MDQQVLIESVVQEVLQRLGRQGNRCQALPPNLCPVGVSIRHVHLSRDKVEFLFGAGHELRKKRELQPGQFAAEETVILVGPKAAIHNVRVLGPARDETQVEISLTDGFHLGLKPPVRDSGDFKGSEKIGIVGPRGAFLLDEGVICARRHIHMHPREAEALGIRDGDEVAVKTGGIRRLVLQGVLVRVSENYRMELHIDTDEANASALKNGDLVEIIVDKD